MELLAVISLLAFAGSQAAAAEAAKSVIVDPCAFVSSFTLTDPRLNKTIGRLPLQLHLGDYYYSTAKAIARRPAFNIKVEINDSNCPVGQHIRSVFVEYTSTAEKSRRFCEMLAPFTVFGDYESIENGTISNSLGKHIFPDITANATVRAIPYFEEKCNMGNEDNTTGDPGNATESANVIRRGKLKQQSFQILASNEPLCYKWMLMKTIKGKAKFDSFGYSLSMSDNGCALAIGAPGNDDYGDNAGSVQVWSCSVNGSYAKLGSDLYGENSFDSGFWTHNFIATSADGTILARGANGNDESGQNAGHVRVWRWSESTATWERMGQDIDGKAHREVSGATVAMSGDGTVLAISSGSGHRVWRWDASKGKWLQRGQDIKGFVFAMSSDANTLAGKPTVASGAPQPLQVWRWRASNKTFYQVGQDLFGSNPQNENFGSSVALSADGKTMAVGVSDMFTLAVEIIVYSWDADTNTWTQRGQEIKDSTNVFFASQVALSRDGTTVAVGHQTKDPSNNIDTNGHVRVWRWDEKVQNWKQLGNDIEGQQLSDRTGDALAISADGTIIAVGAPNSLNKRGNAVGLVRIWKIIRTECDSTVVE